MLTRLSDVAERKGGIFYAESKLWRVPTPFLRYTGMIKKKSAKSIIVQFIVFWTHGNDVPTHGGLRAPKRVSGKRRSLSGPLHWLRALLLGFHANIALR